MLVFRGYVRFLIEYRSRSFSRFERQLVPGTPPKINFLTNPHRAIRHSQKYTKLGIHCPLCAWIFRGARPGTVFISDFVSLDHHLHHQGNGCTIGRRKGGWWQIHSINLLLAGWIWMKFSFDTIHLWWQPKGIEGFDPFRSILSKNTVYSCSHVADWRFVQRQCWK